MNGEWTFSKWISSWFTGADWYLWGMILVFLLMMGYDERKKERKYKKKRKC